MNFWNKGDIFYGYDPMIKKIQKYKFIEYAIIGGEGNFTGKIGNKTTEFRSFLMGRTKEELAYNYLTRAFFNLYIDVSLDASILKLFAKTFTKMRSHELDKISKNEFCRLENLKILISHADISDTVIDLIINDNIDATTYDNVIGKYAYKYKRNKLLNYLKTIDNVVEIAMEQGQGFLLPDSVKQIFFVSE